MHQDFPHFIEGDANEGGSTSNPLGTIAEVAAALHIAAHVITWTLCSCPVVLLGTAGGAAYYVLTRLRNSK